MIKGEVDLLVGRSPEGVRDAGHGPEDERYAFNTFVHDVRRRGHPRGKGSDRIIRTVNVTAEFCWDERMTALEKMDGGVRRRSRL